MRRVESGKGAKNLEIDMIYDRESLLVLEKGKR